MKQDNWCKRTTIHTQVSATHRISSVWRAYENAHFEQWAWETFVFKRGEYGIESVDFQPKTTTDITDLMRLHKTLYDKIVNKEPYETD